MKREIYTVQVQNKGRWCIEPTQFINEHAANKTAQRLSEEGKTLTKVLMNGRPRRFYLNGREPDAGEFVGHVWLNLKAGWDKMIDELKNLTPNPDGKPPYLSPKNGEGSSPSPSPDPPPPYAWSKGEQHGNE